MKILVQVFCAVALIACISDLYATEDHELIPGERQYLDAIGFAATIPLSGPVALVDKPISDGLSHEVGRTIWAPVRIPGKAVIVATDPTNEENWRDLGKDIARTALSPLSLGFFTIRGIFSLIGVPPLPEKPVQ